MNIRTAAEDDLDAITAIEKECFPEKEAASRASFQKRLRTYPDHFYLMEEDGSILGFVNGMVTDLPHLEDEMYDNAALHRENGAWQMIFGVDTIPACRRQGIAGQLLTYAIEEARKQHRKGLVLTCKEELLHYYAKFGFENEGISASTHGDVRWYEMRLTF